MVNKSHFKVLHSITLYTLNVWSYLFSDDLEQFVHNKYICYVLANKSKYCIHMIFEQIENVEKFVLSLVGGWYAWIKSVIWWWVNQKKKETNCNMYWESSVNCRLFHVACSQGSSYAMLLLNSNEVWRPIRTLNVENVFFIAVEQTASIHLNISLHIHDHALYDRVTEAQTGYWLSHTHTHMEQALSLTTMSPD